MNKGLWIGLSLVLITQPISAAKPTMQYSTQPSGAAYSSPISFNVYNLAPIPQDLCGPTLSTGAETATCTGLPLCKGTPAKTASFSCSVTTSCEHTVPGNNSGGNCSISLNVTKPRTLASSTQFSFILSYGSYNALLTSNNFNINGTEPSPPASSYRTITFKNSCNNTVWFGSITGAAPTFTILTGNGIDCTGDNAAKLACVNQGGACYARIGAPDACFSQLCSSDADCVSGASCYAAKGKCFWNNPTPSNQSFQLTHNQSNTIQIPQYVSNGLGVVWSGAFGGRTGCTTGTCTSALCTAGGENAEGVCSLGVGFQQPATQAEPTFITFPTGSPASQVSDAYDVTVINGANVPMSMYPTGEDLSTLTNPYTCGAPGYNLAVPSTSVGSANYIGAASWALANNQTNLAYRYVIPSSSTATRCAADSDCSAGQDCGLAYSSQSIGSTASPGSGYLVCGTFAGWFTADQICGTNNSFTNAINKNDVSVKNFQCNTPLVSPAPSGTMSNLYQCNGNYAESCYTAGANNYCCGCVDWWNQGTSIQVPSTYTTSCGGVANSTWTGSFNSNNQPQVYDTILYLKESCPSCYTYPFDDKSSSFTCSNGSSSTNNTENYTVEFCPGGAGNTGFQP